MKPAYHFWVSVSCPLIRMAACAGRYDPGRARQVAGVAPCGWRPHLDPAGTADACLAATSGLQHAQRTAVEGTVVLPPVVPLVRGSEH